MPRSPPFRDLRPRLPTDGSLTPLPVRSVHLLGKIREDRQSQRTSQHCGLHEDATCGYIEPMIPAVTKALDDLTQQDLEALCDKRWPESQNVEFKSGLSADHGKQDPWHDNGPVGDYAKRKLFKEIVALANSSGGRLFLGIDESKEKPPAAESVCPLPRCHDLAESLERAANDWIEPPLTPMKVKGVPISDDGSGVVVFDVQSSHKAPHRSKDLHCYTRRGTESVPMKMYEIQDLTLRLDRRIDEIKRNFAESKTEFRVWADRRRPEAGLGVAFRVTAIPTGAPLYIPGYSTTPK
jgi:Schlafen, AlbA_2